MPGSIRKAYLQMHFCILLWGFTAILGKLITLNEGMLVWYRMFFSGLSTLIFIIAIKKFQLLSVKETLRICGVGAVVTLHWITFYGAIKASNVSIAISCFSSIALFTAIIDSFWNRKLPRKEELLLSIAVMIGVYIIFTFQQFYLKGIVLSLCSAFLGALFSVMNKQLLDKHDGALITFYELSSGFILLTLILPFYLYLTDYHFEYLSGNNMIYMLVLSVVCTTLPFTLSLYALKKLDAFTMSLSVNLEPLYSIILAILLFQEDKMLNTGFYIGSLIIILSVVAHGIYRYQNKKKIAQQLPAT